MAASTSLLPDTLVESVLEKLELRAHPPLDLAGLASVYAAWCRHVPFDNVRKLIYLHEGIPGPLPGDLGSEFLRAWLQFGTGGTCWAANGALHDLLIALGFQAKAAVGTMLVVPNLPPNHGSVIVDCEGQEYLCDASILHGLPLCLEPGSAPALAGLIPPTVRISFHDERWHIWWQPLHLPAGIECRLDEFPVNRDDFHARYEQTRSWSPFNYELTVRLVKSDKTIGIGRGPWVEIDSQGEFRAQPVTLAERNKRLIELIGLSEEIVARLPADRPTPPPPGSMTARNQNQN